MLASVSRPMSSIASATKECAHEREQRVLLQNVPWKLYESLLAWRGEENVTIGLTYLAGDLEIMGTTAAREQLRRSFAWMLESYFREHDLPIHPCPSTFRSVANNHGLEPDECYHLASSGGEAFEEPALAVEVALSGWMVDKLRIYASLRVPEFWLVRQEQVEVYLLRFDAYERVQRSHIAPQLELNELLRFALRPDQIAAVRDYRIALHRRNRATRSR